MAAGIANLAGITHEELRRRVRAGFMDDLARGYWISYRDKDYPGEIIREYPDGRRFTVHVAPDLTIYDGREVPPKDRSGPPDDGRWWVTETSGTASKDRTCPPHPAAPAT